MKYLIVIICLFLFEGCCILPGDGAFRVTGAISNQKTCEIVLCKNNGEEIIRSEEISGNFTTTLIVGGCRKEYVLKCICDEELLKEVQITYGKDAVYYPPYNIGNI